MAQYQFTPADKPPTDWAKIILAIWAILAGIAIFVVFVWNPLNLISDKVKAFYNGGVNQGIAIGEPNPSGTVPSGSGGEYNCDTDTYNCANFQTQLEAQKAFDFCFKDFGDIHHLDEDGNRKACESLPQ